TRQIDEQCAIGKSACRANLHKPLQAVPRQRASRAKNRNQCKAQFLSNLQPVRRLRWMASVSANKKLLARSCQESSAPVCCTGAVMANSIALNFREKCSSCDASAQQALRRLATAFVQRKRALDSAWLFRQGRFFQGG